MIAEELRAALREVLREELPRILAELTRPAANDADLLDVEAAGKRLGLSPSTVYKRASKCEIPSVKVGSRLLFRSCDLDAYTQARRRSPERVRQLAANPGQSCNDDEVRR